MSQTLTRTHAIDSVVGLITLISLPLFVYGLGSTYLWQDEAQTALLGRSVLRYGVPMVGSGSESLSAHMGTDAGLHGMYFQISWLQAYIAAASFKLFGESSWSARILFAIAGWLCVPLSAWIAMRAAQPEGRVAARIAALFVATSVPFIVCARQARYYTLTAVLVLAVAGAYAALLRRVEVHRPVTIASLGFAAAATFLVLSFDVVAIGVLGATALHWMVFRELQGSPAISRSIASRSFWIAWWVAILVLAVWITLSLSAPVRQNNVGIRSIPDRFRHGIPFYVGQIDAHILPLLIGVPAMALSFVRRTRSLAIVLMLVAAGGTAGAMLSPYRFFRYIVPIAPLVFVLAAIGLANLWHRGGWQKAVTATVVAVLISSTALHVLSHAAIAAMAKATRVVHVRDRAVPLRIPMAEMLRELRDPPRGPIAATVDYLQQNARSNAVVVTTYGELPLKFYTRLQVYGGETAQLPPSGTRVDWIWPRQSRPTHAAVRDSVDWVKSELERGGYERVELGAIDRRWENREDPAEHIFSNPGPPGPNVVLYRAVD
jgi:4-amino-4-deoxy-L-arabinose transferase-like glycosyltransferase